jgi:hypothetical protein
VLFFVSVWCVILCDVFICAFCLIAVSLPPDKNPFAVLINNNNNNNDNNNGQVKDVERAEHVSRMGNKGMHI